MNTTAQRVAKHRQKAAQAGHARISLSLPPDCVARLLEITSLTGEKRSQLILRLIRHS